GHDARAGMDRDAADIVAHQFAFAGVHSRTYFDTKLSDRERYCERTAHRSRGTIERRQKTVAGSVGFLPAETRQFLSHNGVVRIQKIAPGGAPSSAARSVEEAISRKSMVARIRSEESIGRSPVMNFLNI